MRRAGIEGHGERRAGVDRALRDMLADGGRDLLVVFGEEHRDRRRGRDPVIEQREAAAAGIEGERGAEAGVRALADHHVQRGRAAVRPALQEDAVRIDVAPRAQEAERAFGIERAHGLLVDGSAVGIVMGEAAKAMRLAARPKAVGQKSKHAAGGPELAPHLMPLRKRARIAAGSHIARNQLAVRVDVGRIRPGAAVQQHDRGMRPGAGGPKQVGDDLGRAVGAFEIDGLGGGEYGGRCEQREGDGEAAEASGHVIVP